MPWEADTEKHTDNHKPSVQRQNAEIKHDKCHVHESSQLDAQNNWVKTVGYTYLCCNLYESGPCSSSLICLLRVQHSRVVMRSVFQESCFSANCENLLFCCAL